jgi:hypothetical protein
MTYSAGAVFITAARAARGIRIGPFLAKFPCGTLFGDAFVNFKPRFSGIQLAPSEAGLLMN